MKKIPHSVEAEKEVILSLMSNSKLLHDFKDILQPNDFYLPYTAHAYKCLLALFQANAPIDTAYLIAEMEKKDPEMETSWLIEMYFGDEASINQRVNFLKELARRRKTIEKTTELLQVLYDEKPYDELIDSVGKSLFEIGTVKKKSLSLETQFINAFDIINARLDGTNVVKTGFTEIDKMISGILSGQLIIVGARPGMGKTSFALSLLHNVMSLGKKVLFFSLEMPGHEILMKSLSIEAQIPYQALVNGIHTQTSEAFNDIKASIERIKEWPYVIEDSVYSLTDIKNTARQHAKEHELKLIVVDYLGLIEHSVKKNDTKANEISDITRAFKLLARELNIPIVLLCQLNRETDKGGGDNIPRLHNLKDSGSIEQDADIVMFLFREHYYNKEQDPTIAKVFIAKQRLGPLGEVTLHFEPELMHFSDK